MKLTYRGIEYDYNPPALEVTGSDIECQYRGQRCGYTYVKNVPIPQVAAQLRYRGVAYQTTRYGQVQPLAAVNGSLASVSASPRKGSGKAIATLRSKLTGTSPAAQARRELLADASRHHQQNIARSLEHRIEVARAQGNQALLQQLESEMSQSV